MSAAPIRVGVLGLGRAFTLMLPTFVGDRRVKLVSAFDPREGARLAFEVTFQGRSHGSVEAVCADTDVEWIYVATPHQMHVDHVLLAAKSGKHVLVEKPMAVSLDDCSRMIEACEDAGTQLIVGHSHSFNAPVKLARTLIDAGSIGEVRFIHAMQYTDFLYRPRRPEELDTSRGGGVVFSQAAHQMDIVRLLAGGQAHSVRALTGRWDPARPTEGAYSALITFAGGAFASATYNGYGFYDTDTLMDGIGELGGIKNPNAHQETRTRLAAVTDEAAEAAVKAERTFGGSLYQPAPTAVPDAAQHFGPIIVSGDRGDLRLTPRGVWVFDSKGQRFETAELPAVPRGEVVDELWSVAREGFPPVHGARWSRATVELCLALLESQSAGADIILRHQVAL
jgi:phthalate 4,5-cis-dihydrodiol dehydrogenase